MNKQVALKIVNPLLAVAMTIQAITGMLHSVIPYELFRPIHGINGWLLIVLVTTHVILNWGWIKMNMMKKK